MTTAYEIPFTPNAQTFVISLAGTDYALTTHYCAPSACWIMDIATPDGTAIVSGIPLVPGIDLLEQYPDVGIGGQIFVQSQGDINATPGYADLGVDGLVFFVTP